MQKDIQPQYNIVDVTCACGTKFKMGTVLDVKELKVDICSKCHPFYTGKQKSVAVGGRIERFNKKFGSNLLNK
ncbi:MAG: 50S ribosomal protein L31 [Clostridia bacterium]|nr:50S ribosomal protein L31 [Clostridia bacterium]